MILRLRLKIILIVIPLIIVILSPLISGRVETSVFWGVEISDTIVMVIVIIFWGIMLFALFPEN
jgi:hypothetical protein